MTSLTIFSTPKPFTDPHIDLIQRNAIQSWQRAGEDVEVILIGEEDGLAEVAAEYGTRHLPNVTRNEFDTPLISSIFQLAREASDSELLVYVNADIILTPDFQEVVQQVAAQASEFSAVGHRWDLDIRRKLSFSVNWSESIKTEAKTKGKRQGAIAIDYFVFPRRLYTQIPDFAIGRPSWDNWMIYHACERGWPVIDLTPSLMVIHQNHGYGHLPGGTWGGLEESSANLEAAGGRRHLYFIVDATHEFIDGQIRRSRWNLAKMIRRLERWVKPDEPKGKRGYISRRLYKLWMRVEK